MTSRGQLEDSERTSRGQVHELKDSKKTVKLNEEEDN